MVVLRDPYYVVPGSICLYIGKDLGVYVHGVVSVGRFMSCFFNGYRFSILLKLLLVYAVPMVHPPSLWLGTCLQAESWDNSRAHLLVSFSWVSQSHVAYRQFLKTPVSCILSSFPVVPGRRVNVGFVLPLWPEMELHKLFQASKRMAIFVALSSARSISLDSKL